MSPANGLGAPAIGQGLDDGFGLVFNSCHRVRFDPVTQGRVGQGTVGHILIGGVVLGVGLSERHLNFAELPLVGIHIGRNRLGTCLGGTAAQYRSYLIRHMKYSANSLGIAAMLAMKPNADAMLSVVALAVLGAAVCCAATGLARASNVADKRSIKEDFFEHVGAVLDRCYHMGDGLSHFGFMPDHHLSGQYQPLNSVTRICDLAHPGKFQ